MKKLNVLILADTLEVYGGAERHVLDLARNLDKSKYNLFVSSLIPGGSLLSEISSLGVNVRLFPVRRIYSIFGIARGIEFARFLKRNKIDILMTLHFGSDVWGVIFGKLAGVPTIISNRRDIGFWKKKRHILAYRLINRYVDAIIVNSHAGKNKVIKDEKVLSSKIKVVHGAVDVDRFNKTSSGKEDKIVIGAVGNFNPIKGHKYLIEAFLEVVKKEPNTKLMLVGDGPLRSELREIASLRHGGAYNSKKIIFMGNRTDIPELLSEMDICVLPSLSEGLSNALMEYMAAGKPIIATRVGGNPELIENNVSGILVEPASSSEIEKAIIGLIKDRQKAKRLAQNAKRYAKKELDMSTMIRKYENILDKKHQGGILHLISSSGLFGAENVLLNIARFNQQNNTDVIVSALKNAHNPHTEVIRKAERMGLKTAIFDSSGRVDVKTIFAIRRFISKNRIGVIHTHNYKSDIAGFLATRFTKTRWIATNHVWHSTDAKLRFYEKIDAFLLKFASKVIAVSDEIGADLVKNGIKRSKIERIHNGIDIWSFNGKSGDVRHLRKELGINNSDIVITTIGRLSPEKGYKELLEAAKAVAADRDNVKFLIVGDGPLKSQLLSMAKDMGLDKNISFLGLRDDIGNILSESDIYVNSSYVEGLPLSVLEAMSSRLPIVATRAGAIPKVINDGTNGILVNCGDVNGIVKAINLLIFDKQKGRQIAEQAYKDVCDKFSIERMGRDYSAVYQEVLA